MKAIASNLPTVALVGRANVGKSTLWNRLTETRGAMVSAIAGTTRDRKEAPVLWRGAQFRLIDTGGLDHPHGDTFVEEVEGQVGIAIQEADVVLFVVDLQEGALAQDRDIASRLQRIDKPVILVGNKSDKNTTAALDAEWYNLPFNAPRPVSAIRGNGLGDLLDEIYETLERMGKPPLAWSEPHPIPRIAIVGIPNVGKSSIVNEILGEHRFITSPVAHTTREANDTLVEFDKREYLLIDTAGIRRQARVQAGIEHAGVRQSLERLRQADIVVLVLDAGKAIDTQEQNLGRLIREAGVGCVIALNKWDLVREKNTSTVHEVERDIRRHLPHLRYAPILTISAKERMRIHKLFGLFDTIMEERNRRVEQTELERFLHQTVARHKPSRGKGVAHPTVLDFRQTGVRPPTFGLLVKGRRTDVLHPSYVRFLENRLRETFGFGGTPIEIRSIAEKPS